MHYLYILYSKTLNRFYVGETQNIDKRIILHNSRYFKKAFTKSASDWKVVLGKKCNIREEAMYLESFIKRMKSKKFIEKVIATPNILDDILNKK